MKILMTFAVSAFALSVANAQMVKDIYSGAQSSLPAAFTNCNGLMFFFANDEQSPSPSFGKELWRSDGTGAGTFMVKKINVQGTASVLNLHLICRNNIVYFSASNGVANGEELWRSDGTAAGTTLVKDITPNSFSSSPERLVLMNNQIYFFADNLSNGRELWRSNGTESGTVMVKDILPGSNGQSPYLNGYEPPLVHDNNLYFTAQTSQNGNTKLFKSNGTESGTVMVKDMGFGRELSNFISFNGKIYFTTYFWSSGNELWVSDGTETGTFPFQDISPNVGKSPSHLTVFNGNLFFKAHTQISGLELWKTDGTNAGTTIVKDIGPFSQSGIPAYSPLMVVGNNLFFVAYQLATGTELWKTDGTEAGTQIVKDINQDSTSSIEVWNGMQFGSFGGELLFTADNGFTGHELFRSDGTANGTVLAMDIAPPSRSGNSSFPTHFHEYNGQLYFVADDGTHGRELWKYSPISGRAESIAGLELKVFPNPAQNTLTIKPESNPQFMPYTIFNLLGQELLSGMILQEDTIIDISSLKQGCYVLQIVGNTKYSTRFIKN